MITRRYGRLTYILLEGLLIRRTSHFKGCHSKLDSAYRCGESQGHRRSPLCPGGIQTALDRYQHKEYICTYDTKFSGQCGAVLAGSLRKRLRSHDSMFSGDKSPYAGSSLPNICGKIQAIQAPSVWYTALNQWSTPMRFESSLHDRCSYLEESHHRLTSIRPSVVIRGSLAVHQHMYYSRSSIVIEMMLFMAHGTAMDLSPSQVWQSKDTNTHFCQLAVTEYRCIACNTLIRVGHLLERIGKR